MVSIRGSVISGWYLFGSVSFGIVYIRAIVRIPARFVRKSGQLFIFCIDACDAPYKTPTATHHTKLSLRRTIRNSHCDAPYETPTATHHTKLPLRRTIQNSHCDAPYKTPTATHHTKLPLRRTIQNSHCDAPYETPTATHHTKLPLRRTIRNSHCDAPYETPTATHHTKLPLRRTIQNSHCDAPYKTPTAKSILLLREIVLFALVQNTYIMRFGKGGLLTNSFSEIKFQLGLGAIDAFFRNVGCEYFCKSCLIHTSLDQNVKT